MSQKAVSIANYVVASGLDTYLGIEPQVKGSSEMMHLITDGSRVHIDPLMTKSFYFHDILRTEGAAKETISRQIVSGFTCMEHDRLFEIKDEPQLIPGDRIHYHKVGAYTMCLSPLFIKWFPDVYVKSGEEITKVRTRWDADAYRNGHARLQPSVHHRVGPQQ
jgi:diaminopimelate decarboxylase